MSAPAGAAHHAAKITEEQVREIKQLLAASVRQADIAERFGVDRTTICNIKTGRSWSHVTIVRRIPKKKHPTNPEPVECKHKNVTHQHGTHAMYSLDGCRCIPCRRDHTAHRNRTDRLKAYGRYDRYNQPVGPVRDHIVMLRGAGITPARLSEISGVSEFAIFRVLRSPDSGIVRARTARRILAVQPSPENAAGHAIVDSTGTRRRVEALVAIGWNLKQLTEMLGYSPTQIPRMLAGEPVRMRTAREVARFYDVMWDRPAPAGRSRAFALRMAAERRYYPPLARDDDEIDDPAAKPHGEWRAVA
jgi:DNA-binding XRE family transcriptional regulator